MGYRLGSNPIGSNQEQFPLLQDFLASAARPRTESSMTACNLGIPDEEVNATMLADPQGCAGPRTIRIDNKCLPILDGMSPARVAGLATRNEVPGGIVELVTIEMIHDKVVFGGTSSRIPGNHLLAPVARMAPGTNRVVKGFSMFHESPASRGQRMSLLRAEDAIPRLQYSLR